MQRKHALGTGMRKHLPFRHRLPPQDHWPITLSPKAFPAGSHMFVCTCSKSHLKSSRENLTQTHTTGLPQNSSPGLFRVSINTRENKGSSGNCPRAKEATENTAIKHKEGSRIESWNAGQTLVGNQGNLNEVCSSVN